MAFGARVAATGIEWRSGAVSADNIHDRAMALFDHVCDLSPADRETELSKACTGNPELREKVEALLLHDDAVIPFVAAAESGQIVAEFAAGQNSSSEQGAQLPDRIGPYQIIRQIGEGGMGIIYEAQQASPRRRVALKILRPGLVGRDMLKRFQHEAHVLGQLQHPGIAQIHEAGVAELPQGQQPFFVMEFVDGEPLNRFADARKLETRQRLELLARICDAVQHAHQKGIIHRDLKPSNVLVVDHHDKTSIKAQPATQTNSAIDLIGQPKVLDFGIARVTDADLQTITVQTEIGQLVGTLAYMSPEQIEGDSTDLDSRCDVYALGVMLYQLLVGKRPHDLTGKAVTEAARIVREEEPATVGEIDKSLRGDIETIVAKAMDKDRNRRYGSAAEFATDIRRYLTHQPIEARPASTFYQLSKFARRNTGLVTGMAATFAMLVVALIGTSYGLMQAKSQRDAATAANTQLQTVVDYQSAMLKDLDVVQMGRHIADDLRSEATASLADGGDSVAPQLDAFEQVLSRINTTTIASRALDSSIMSRAASALDTVFAGEPALRADLRANLSDIYESIGLDEKSMKQARIEWETRKRILGPEDPDTLEVMQRICELQIELGQFEDAKVTAQELIEVRRHVLGPDHLATLVAHRLLGVVHLKLTELDESLNQLQMSLSGLEKTVGFKHPAALHTRAELGTFYLHQRDSKRAREMYERVLSEYEDQFGPDHDDTLTVMGNLARTHFMEQNYAQAQILLEQMSHLLAVKKGEDHPDVLVARLKLGNNLTEMREYEKAEPIVRDTLARSRRVHGSDHPNTVSALSAGLRLMLKLERWTEAEDLGREALAIAQRTLGSDNMRTLDAGHNLVAVYLKSENHEPAIDLGTRMLTEYQRVLGSNHIRTLGMQQSLAKVFLSAGRWDKANDHIQDALPKLRKSYSNKSVLAGTLGHGVTALVLLERGDEAEELARELLTWCEDRSAGEGTIGRCYLWIARTQVEQGRHQEANESLTVALQRMAGTVPDSYWAMTFAHLLTHAIAFQAGEIERLSAVTDAYHQLIATSQGMMPEERNTILAETRRVMRRVGIESGGNEQ